MFPLNVLHENILALLLFSCIVLFVYYLLPISMRKYLLLVVSALFYVLCDAKMFFVLACTLLWTWFCARQIEKTAGKRWVVLGFLPVAFVLLFFKHNRFFVSSVDTFLATFGMGSTGGIINIIMPLGISYYSFKAISYILDVYKGKITVKTSLADYALYLLYFAEVISGPISRYNAFKTALDDGMRYSHEHMERGFYCIVRGLFMKAVIANRLSAYVATIFAAPEGYPGIALWIAAFFYAVQLYCDFAGYSSIVVGITQLFGLFPVKNFIRPYFSVDIRDFWSRWHISLSSWLRDYIYIPLGGSKCSKFRRNCNVLIVFLASGLWHGSGLNFVVWGLYHGLLNIITPKRRSPPEGIKKAGAIFLNFCLVTFGWIFFGTESLSVALRYISRMFTNLSFSFDAIQQAILPITGDNTCVAFFLLVVMFIVILAVRELHEERRKIDCYDVGSFVWQVFLLSMVLVFGSFGASGFIYANF